jgi:CRP-like cAMP-binding protein
VPLLSDLTEQAFARVLENAVVQRLGHGALLIRAGDPGDSFFLLASGEVRVFTGEAPAQTELAHLHEGAIFGEMALINAQPRSASVEVVGSADIISFGRKALEAAAGELEAVAAALEKFTRDRLLKNLLATSPLFKPFTHPQRIDLVRRFTGHDIAEGDAIIRQGDRGEGLYVLLSGGVEVVQGGEPFETQLAELRPGDCFGEISLVLELPAMATVRATRRSTVLFLAREYFQRLTEALPEILNYFEELAAERLRAASVARLDPEDLLEEDGDSRVLF